ncbi:hypothetical protein [Aureispira sp. CCB-E]|uniref:hypothetical protein n=1 Tax=Aureispira sp. CCB-E TaxID=3051121 RepID=UPI0028695D7B|nr:hypothetical protein [Aureispira sp. CCB-E]WMX16265.1 hypothetical protein QP953_07790 [Aureispira sp. CCB-E]
MTIEDLLTYITNDKTALFLFFILLPILTIIITAISRGRSLEKPYSYLYSMLLFEVCIPGVLSITLWIYSMFFERKALWQLPFFIYYLPVIIMVLCIYILKKKRVSIRRLPWTGELYEFLVLLIITFASLLIIMKLHIISFNQPWQLGLFALLCLSTLHLLWKRMASLR